VLAAMCLQIVGETSADLGNPTNARSAYDLGIELATKAKSAERITTLTLGRAQLDLDDKGDDTALEPVVALQKRARRDRALSCEANAAVLNSQIRLAKGDRSGVLDVFEDLNFENLQTYRIKTMARIAYGQVLGYLGEGDDDGDGLAHIEAAQADAERRGFWGLVLEAKLARLRVMITRGDKAESERDQLIGEANGRGYKRIAQLARKFTADAPAEQPATAQPTPPPEP